MPVTKGTATTLQKRIVKYRDDLIRFVTHPDVEFHNNRAERQLRLLVIGRKVSFGSQTLSGALRHCVIHSIVETCKLQNKDPFEFIHRPIWNYPITRIGTKIWPAGGVADLPGATLQKHFDTSIPQFPPERIRAQPPRLAEHVEREGQQAERPERSINL
jgi:hypothetical protein